MLSKDLFKKIRRIEIVTNRLVTDVFAGQYHSVFKGRGMEFDEVREYQIGDDIRSIDWNVTARTGRPHVKKYVEERELTVMLLVDCSLSNRFATRGCLKAQLAAEIAAVLAFSAIRNNDKVGAVFFTDTIEKFVPPRKGRKNVLRLIREILYFQPDGKGTDISQAVEFLSRVMTRRTVSFLISDFFEKGEASGENPGYRKALGAVSKKHDVVAISLNDPAETHFVHPAMLILEDAESGQQMCVDTKSNDFRNAYTESGTDRIRNRHRLFRSLGMDEIFVSTDGAYADEIVKFFMKRRKRK
jgi:uncharacterized protein (DUF58 family)